MSDVSGNGTTGGVRRRSSGRRRSNRSSLRVGDLVALNEAGDDVDDVNAGNDLTREFSMIEAAAGDDVELDDASAINAEELLSGHENRRRHLAWWQKYAAVWGDRLPWLVFVLVVSVGLLAVVIVDRRSDSLLKAPLVNMSAWMVLSIPPFLLALYVVVELVQRLLCVVVLRVASRSSWLVQLVLKQLLRRCGLALFAIVADHLVLRFWMHDQGGVALERMYVAQSVCRLIYLMWILWALRNIVLRALRHHAALHVFRRRVDDLTFAKDALVLLCAIDNVGERDRIRAKWAANKARDAFDNRLRRAATNTMQLPLQIVEDGQTGEQRWAYSARAQVEVGTRQQAKWVAAGLRDALFRNARTLSFARLRTMLGLDDHDVERCFETLFHRNEGDYDAIKPDELFVSVQTLFSDRCDLRQSAESFENAADIVTTICNVVFVVVGAGLAAHAFGASFSALTVGCTTAFAAVGFSLHGTISAVVVSIVFVLVRRPYSVGDRVAIDGGEYTVARIRMMTTEFVGLDNKLMTMPNAQLATIPIFNHRRAGPAVISVKVKVAYATPRAKIDALHAAMRAWVAALPDTWTETVDLEQADLSDGNALLLEFKFQCRSIWHDSVVPGATTDVVNAVRQRMLETGIAQSDPAAWVSTDADGRPL